MIPQSTLDDIRRHAESSVPFECCGLLTRNLSAVPCDNEAKDRTRNFAIRPMTVAAIVRRLGVSGMYHSHVNAAAFVSDKDRAGYHVQNGLYVIASVINGVCRDIKIYAVCGKSFVEINQ